MRGVLRSTVLLGAFVAMLPLTPARAETGITDTTITIGLHAPLTGAAPVKADAFDAGKDLYWKWIKSRGETVFGRDVQVLIQDDQGSPSSAVSACKQLAEQQGAFLLVGGAGTDQIQACAQYADHNAIPYVSGGITESGMAGLASSFALSMTYRAQGPIVAQFIVNRLGNSVDRYGPVGLPTPTPTPSPTPASPPIVCTGVAAVDALIESVFGGRCDPRAPPSPAPDPGRNPDGQVKIALVRPDEPNFDDAESGLRAGLQAVGRSLDAVETVPKEDSPNLQSRITAAVDDMRSKGIDVVVVVTSPTVTVQLDNAADARQYFPRYVGPGATNAINQVLPLMCGHGTASGFQSASFLSPWPAWDDVNNHGRFDPDFHTAATMFAPSQNIANGGDLMLDLWGIMKDIHRMLLAAGPNPTRSGLIASLDESFSTDVGVYPALSYSPGQHFGAVTANRLEADCADQQWHTKEAFVSGYPAQ